MPIILNLLLLQCLFRRTIAHNSEDLNKLDPRLKTAIAEDLPDTGIEPTGANIDPVQTDEDGTNWYGAIVYTSDPQELEKIGIHINSKVADFVTTRVTAAQLLQIIKLKSVTHIDAGEELTPDKN